MTLLDHAWLPLHLRHLRLYGAPRVGRRFTLPTSIT
jgi:hypothetical protein